MYVVFFRNILHSVWVFLGVFLSCSASSSQDSRIREAVFSYAEIKQVINAVKFLVHYVSIAVNLPI